MEPSPTTSVRRPIRPSLWCGSSLVRSPDTVRASTRMPVVATRLTSPLRVSKRMVAAAVDRAVDPDVAARRATAASSQPPRTAMSPETERIVSKAASAGELDSRLAGNGVDLDLARRPRSRVSAETVR